MCLDVHDCSGRLAEVQPAWCVLQKQVYRWARCRRPMPQAKMWAAGVPLPEGHLEVLKPGLAWEDMQVRALVCICVDRRGGIQSLGVWQCVTRQFRALGVVGEQKKCDMCLPAARSVCMQGQPTTAIALMGIDKPFAHTAELTSFMCVQWSPTGVAVKGKAYHIVRLHFTKRRPLQGGEPAHGDAGAAAVQNNAYAGSVPMET